MSHEPLRCNAGAEGPGVPGNMKTNIKAWLRGLSAGVVLGGVALVSPGCVFHESVPAGGGPYGAYYDYDYYPGANVYYYPSGNVYYWSDGGRWYSGRRLPPRYVLRDARPEHYRSHSREPWRERQEHHEHEEFEHGQGD